MQIPYVDGLSSLYMILDYPHVLLVIWVIYPIIRQSHIAHAMAHVVALEARQDDTKTMKTEGILRFHWLSLMQLTFLATRDIDNLYVHDTYTYIHKDTHKETHSDTHGDKHLVGVEAEQLQSSSTRCTGNLPLCLRVRRVCERRYQKKQACKAVSMLKRMDTPGPSSHF